MKKIFLAAACLALFSCINNENPIVPEEVDNIQIAPESREIAYTGGSVNVIVTSSGEWILSSKADYSWVAPSMSQGIDGDIVKFTIEENTTGEKLTSEWTFTCGKASKTFILTSLPEVIVPETLEITSPSQVTVDYNKGEFIVLANSSLHYRDITVTLGKGAESWLKHVTNLEGETEGSAKLVFQYAAYTGLEDLTETITLSGERVETPIEISVVQEAKHVMILDKEFYTVSTNGETITVPFSTNVEFGITVSEDAKSWLSAEKAESGIKVTATALTGSKRQGTIKLTQTDAKEGEQTLEKSIVITQVNTIISWAANMAGNRLFPKWDGTVEKLGNAKKITFECMVNVDEFNNNGISTLMGIEGMFLLRFGDSAPDNVLQIATLNGNYDVDFEFETNRWYHIACVHDQAESSYSTTVSVYVDGELVGKKENWNFQTYVGWPLYQYMYGVNFSPNWSYESDAKRCFWMGYSYDANRDLKGKMTEVRIWKKALTQEEIKADNHFYEVDPASEGLYAYWKFTKGSGEYVEDATGNGNKLYGETNIRKIGNDNKGDAGINWVEVALPDK